MVKKRRGPGVHKPGEGKDTRVPVPEAVVPEPAQSSVGVPRVNAPEERGSSPVAPSGTVEPVSRGTETSSASPEPALASPPPEPGDSTAAGEELAEGGVESRFAPERPTSLSEPEPAVSIGAGAQVEASGETEALVSARVVEGEKGVEMASGTATPESEGEEPGSSSASEAGAAEAPHAPEWSPPQSLQESEPERLEQPQPEPAPSPQPHIQWRPSIFVVQITPELAPVAKVGGLADVVFGLSRELEIRGNHVEIILPKYDCMRYDQIWGLQRTFDDLWVPWYGGAIHCSVYFGFVHGRKCFFIEPHSQDNFFNRGAVYGFHDDVLRFAFFSRAAMEFLWKSGKHPEIIHCHDWQTALVPVFLYEIYQPMGMTHPRVCFTIHNFKHQGVTGAQVLHATGLDRPEYYFQYDKLRDNHNPHAINLMKGGIVYSNVITTVSPRYAMEAKDLGQGFGLEPTLHIHHMKYGGVVNGIDYDVWNPETDPLIPFHFNVDAIDGKYRNKKALRDRLLLADNEKPIVSFVGRLDPQKGIELIRHALFYTLGQRGQFVLLGSSPDAAINGYFWGLKQQLNDNPDCHLEIGYNEELAHLVYAGSDIVVVPSRFEPCGLTQLIAMRYGTIPVVREIGGLADTVVDKDYSHRPLHERNGYVFRDYDEPGLESALGRAIACYYQYPEHFRELMRNAMRYDYSWNHPGQDYLNIYDYIREK